MTSGKAPDLDGFTRHFFKKCWGTICDLPFWPPSCCKPIVATMLATRLGPHMNNRISNAHSAFIKKVSVHDNFTYVRNHARRLHKSKSVSLLFKLDICKAFDSMRWEYILNPLQRRWFTSKFRDWITTSRHMYFSGIPSMGGWPSHQAWVGSLPRGPAFAAPFYHRDWPSPTNSWLS